jgi:hypothetical protein
MMAVLHVIPDLIRDPAVLCGVEEEGRSGIPDHVRDDGMGGRIALSHLHGRGLGEGLLLSGGLRRREGRKGRRQTLTSEAVWNAPGIP